MTIYFSSDHHFGHRNIIKYCNRPFTDVDHMDSVMINNWNSVVTPNDTVYYVGDFQIHPDSNKYLPRLNGKKILIKGNHDYEHKSILKSLHWHEQHDILVMNAHNTKIILCHYGMRVWPKAHKGSVMLYGHSHNRLPGTSHSCDVGVDAWNYTPVSFMDIKKRLNTLPPYKDPSYVI